MPRHSYPVHAAVLLLWPLLTAASPASAQPVEHTERHDFTVNVLTRGLEHPWGLAFLPDGDLLVTERAGRLRRVAADGTLHPQPVAGLPDNIVVQGQGGLLDVALHPDFADNRLVYFSYAGSGTGGVGTELARGWLDEHGLHDVEVLFRALPKSSGGRHFGGRIVFDRAGHVFLTLGDRGEMDRAQRLDDHAGSIIRLDDDGTEPADNPYAGRSAVRSGIYSHGNRNVQGAALNPTSGELWAHEHGPQGGDEVNIIRAGANYGWPVITYGANYVIGTRIGEGTAKPGMEQPVHYWDPSIAPSGMAFYTGDRFPDWRGDLLVGALKFRLLVRLDVEADRVVGEERMLTDRLGRIRDVRVGPDGYVYLLTDERDGVIARLEPAGG